MQRTLTVIAGASDRNFCPVSARVPGLAVCTSARLTDESGALIPAQIDGDTLAFVVSGLRRAEVRRLRLTTDAEPSPRADGFGLVHRPGEALDFIVGGRLFTSYHFADGLPRPYFHPVVGPRGRRVARAFPMEIVEGETRDHQHHRGLWVAHGDVNGVDCWSEAHGHGTIAHREFESLTSGPAFARAVERLEWRAADGRRVLSERRTVTVHNLPSESRKVDLDVCLIASDGPVTLGDTKEAGLISIRVATSMDGNKGGLIENGAGGAREAATWGREAPWCHYSGPVEGEMLGIGLIDHPLNPRYPTNWHVRDYGLMTANPFGLHDFFPGSGKDGSLRIEGGESATFRYRVFIHDGDAAAGRMHERHADFAAPPAVAVE
jgi:hypothetical protein